MIISDVLVMHQPADVHGADTFVVEGIRGKMKLYGYDMVTETVHPG